MHLGTMIGLLLLLGTAANASPFIPNDPGYAAVTWYGPVLNMPTAWGYNQGSPSVIAAVLDTGVIASTPDLSGRVLSPVSIPGLPPFDPTFNTHGTWVASALAMQINNGLGGAGVGNFSILPIAITDSIGTSLSPNIATAIRLAADHGAKVINISSSAANYGLLNDAAAYAHDKGALTFVAMGNDNSYVGLDGSPLPNLIFVSGTDTNDARWVKDSLKGSNYGPYVSLAAPAYNILAADPTESTGYVLVSGTSLATPLVAGAAALAWSINPDLTPDQVQSILFTTAKDLGLPGRDEEFGYGRIDIGAVAAAAAATVPEPATIFILGIPALALLIRRPRRRCIR